MAAAEGSEEGAAGADAGAPPGSLEGGGINGGGGGGGGAGSSGGAGGAIDDASAPPPPAPALATTASGGGSAKDPAAVLGKYKKLLSLAKQGLEENQRIIAEKDEQLARLLQEIENLKALQYEQQQQYEQEKQRQHLREREGGVLMSGAAGSTLIEEEDDERAVVLDVLRRVDVPDDDDDDDDDDVDDDDDEEDGDFTDGGNANGDGDGRDNWHRGRKSSVNGGDGQGGKRRKGAQPSWTVWLLMEFEKPEREWRRRDGVAAGAGGEAGGRDRWMPFRSESDATDYVRSHQLGGEPLTVPHACLGPEESEDLRNQCLHTVNKITEEFRRYKVRAEIALKQRENECRQLAAKARQQQELHQQMLQATGGMMGGGSGSGSGSGYGSSSSASSAGTSGDAGGGGGDAGGMRGAGSTPERGVVPRSPSSDSAESDALAVQRLRAQLDEQETKWRSAYGAVVRENEKLRTKGGEAVLAAQWRQRYEQCMSEKTDLQERLKMVMQRGVDGEGGMEDFQRRFLEMKNEYREYRRRAVEAVNEKERIIEQLREDMSRHPGGGGGTRLNGSPGAGVGGGGAGGGGRPGGSGSPSFGTGGGAATGDASAAGGGGGSGGAAGAGAPGGGGGGKLGRRGGSRRGRQRGSGGGGAKDPRWQYLKNVIIEYMSTGDRQTQEHMERALFTIMHFTAEEQTQVQQKRREREASASASNPAGAASAAVAALSPDFMRMLGYPG